MLYHNYIFPIPHDKDIILSDNTYYITLIFGIHFKDTYIKSSLLQKMSIYCQRLCSMFGFI